MSDIVRPLTPPHRVSGARLLDSATRIVGRRQGWGHHAESLQENYRALRGSPPHELAALSLAILDIDVAAGILQAAILELAVYIHAVVQHDVLVFENLVLMSVHKFSRHGRPRVRLRSLPASALRRGFRGMPDPRLDEAIIGVPRMQDGKGQFPRSAARRLAGNPNG